MKKLSRLSLLLIALSVSISIAAIADSNEVEMIDLVKQRAVQNISFLTNEQLIDRVNLNPRLILLDVRTEKEFRAGHLPGASWVERGIAEFVLARTVADTDKEIIVYCKKGYRAALVVKALRDASYTNVRAHVGFDQWVDAGYRYENYLGESVLVSPASINSENFRPDYFQPKL